MLRAPVELRPPVRCLTASSGLCGLSVVRSSFASVVVKRRDGVIGRNDLIGIVFQLLAWPGACLLVHFQNFVLYSAFLTGCQCIPASSRPLSGERKPS